MPYEGIAELAQSSARKGRFASNERVDKEPPKMPGKDQGNSARQDNGKLTAARDSLVHDQTALRFSARLEPEDYPRKRSRPTKLLIAKENKFAIAAERLAQLDRHMARCKSFILLLHTLIDKLKRNGRDFRQAERLLRNTLELHDLCLSYRRVLLQGLDRLTTYVRQSHASRKLAHRRPRSLRKPPVGHPAPRPCPSSRRSV